MELKNMSRRMTERNATAVKDSLKSVALIFDCFEGVHNDVLAITEDDDLADADAYYDDVEKPYLTMVQKAHEWLKEVGDEVTVSTQAQSEMTLLANMLSLPKLELKSFSGKPTDYHAFIKVFESAVASHTEDDETRLMRLLQYTSGEAYDLIKRCPVCSDGYNMALRLLKERYGNEDIVTETLLREVRQFKFVRTSHDLRRYADHLSTTYAVLKSIDRLVEVNSQSFIRDLFNAVQPYIRNKWRNRVMETKEKTGHYPNFEQATVFLQRQSDGANDVFYGGQCFDDEQRKEQSSRYKESTSLSTTVSHSSQSRRGTGTRSKYCHQCKCVEHSLWNCPVFVDKLSQQERWNLVHQEHLCWVCLKKGHISWDCQSNMTCNFCDKKHSSLLHRDDVAVNEAGGSSAPVLSSATNVCAGSRGSDVCMPVLTLRTSGHDVTVVLDSASTSSFITRRAANRLQLSGREVTLSVETITGSSTRQTMLVDFELTGDGMTMPVAGVSVIDSIPVSTGMVSVNDYHHLQGIQLNNRLVQNVDILIGQDNGDLLVPLDSRYGLSNQPYAVKYRLGWALGGRSGSGHNQRGVVNFISSIERDVAQLWEMEHGSDEQGLSQDDQHVIDLWDKHTVLRTDKHYEIPIPLKESVCFPNNEYAAQQRLKSLVRSLHRKGLRDKYDDEMEKLVQSGYAEKATDDVSPEGVWYLPHHGVVNDKKPEKLRVVFDCAAEHMGESLNDKCFQGPDLVNRLLDTLLRFREHRYVIMADVESMYYQVFVPQEQRDILRFLWFDKESGDVSRYRMRRHVFGGVWCAASSTYALRRTIHDDPDVPKLVKDVVLNSFYVDDCLVSAHDIEDIRSVYVNVTAQLAKGGFRLTKFLTNCEVLEDIPVVERAKETKPLCETESAKALGMRWNFQEDYFWFDGNKPLDVVMVTRRVMLSFVASTYDPLGLASPIVMVGRLLFQDATKLKLTWDDPLPIDLRSKWSAWIESLRSFSVIKVPRCLKLDDVDDVVMELHHFSDASQRGYGSCSYLRCISKSGVITCNLIMSKSRVAPIKSVTIPRLELQAAVLSVALDEIIKSSMSLLFTSTYFWTDSQIVLGYVRNAGKRFPVFVSNRVAKITGKSSAGQWNHVKGTDNPADVISRGATVDSLNQRLWYEGPAFLKDYKSSWQFQAYTGVSEEQGNEFKEAEVCNAVDVNPGAGYVGHPVDKIAKHYSSWNRMKRALAWLRRYVNRRRGQLSAEEIDQAGIILVKRAQQGQYGDDIARLRSDVSLRKACDLKSLSPFLDENGLIRVGGRLSHANITNQHPVIIPDNHPIAKAIVLDAHTSSHLGVEWVLSIVRQSYWIVRARRVIKPIIKSCVSCRKMYGKPCQQLMANLPSDRVAMLQPAFASVGIDVFGPFYVKVNRSEVKRYVCLYTCMSTRAVHLEKLQSMDTDSFINSFRRFRSRRGPCKSVYSDNGTNFVGGQAEMKRAQECISESTVKKYAAVHGISWYFNPPTASHMGGVWERMVRTVRRVMLGVLHERLNDEILDTALCEVEAIVNGRPLTKLSDDPNDPTPLTPNHLLLLQGNCEPPPGVFTVADTYRKRWRHVQLLADNFWKGFLRLYLPELQKRVKWHTPTTNLKEGDLVMLMDSVSPRNCWPLALVLEAKAGRDGLVRSIKAKTTTSILVRPITKVILLEAALVDL